MSGAEIQAFAIQVLPAAVVVFVIALVGNLLSFSSRFVNALVTAILFAAVYGGIYYAITTGMVSGEFPQLSQQQWIQMIAMSAIIVFVIDLVANMISFNSRVVSALATAIVFVVVFGLAVYASGTLPQMPTAT